MKKTLVALMLLSSLGLGAPVFAAEPSLHEVYQAAGAGKLDDAQRMMREVLQAHPNSGKAHYVEAELLAKQGQLKGAASELATAEKLAPGLPFANAQAVSSLREIVSRHPASTLPPVAQMPPQVAPVSHEASGFPLGMLGLGLALIAFIAWASRFMSRRTVPGAVAGNQPAFAGSGYPPSATPMSPYGAAPQGYGMPNAAPAAAPGMGSQMLGGLATGAAVGAGVVAGEALLHRFMDGHKASALDTSPSTGQGFSSFDSIPDLPSTPLNDMGGNDFGIADTSSWDDDGSSSDSDWN